MLSPCPTQGDISAGKMIFGVEGVDPARRAHLIQLLDIDLYQRLTTMSDGEKRRVQICMGLLKPYEVSAWRVPQGGGRACVSTHPPLTSDDAAGHPPTLSFAGAGCWQQGWSSQWSQAATLTPPYSCPHSRCVACVCVCDCVCE